MESGCTELQKFKSGVSPHSLAVFATSPPLSNVDVFDVTSGTWSSANLSEARRDLTATSLPDFGVAFFAGGQNGAFRGCLFAGSCV